MLECLGKFNSDVPLTISGIGVAALHVLRICSSRGDTRLSQMQCKTIVSVLVHGVTFANLLQAVAHE